jgi:hypothetical protein
MMPSPQGKTGPLAKAKPVPQTLHVAHLSEQNQSATDADRMESLRRQFREFGLSVHQLTGQELAVTGQGAATRTMPDARCAWLYLRQLRGGAV